MTKIGDVNCRAMTLPAAVSLFATAYRRVVAARQNDPMTTVRLIFRGLPLILIYRAMTGTAMIDLAPFRAIPDQGTIFMRRPPRAKHIDEKTISIGPGIFLNMVTSS